MLSPYRQFWHSEHVNNMAMLWIEIHNHHVIIRTETAYNAKRAVR